MKRLPRMLFSLTFIVSVLIGVGIWQAHAWLHSETFRRDVSGALSEALQRDVAISGDIDLSFFPWLGFVVEEVAVGNAEGFAGDFATIGRLAVKVQPLELLDGKVVADTIDADHLSVSLVRGNEGESNNWASFAADIPQSSSEGNATFELVSVRGISVRDADITFFDRRSGRRVSLDDLNIRTGAYRPGKLLAFGVRGSFNLWKKLRLEVSLKGKLDTSFSDETDLIKDSVIDIKASGDYLPADTTVRMTSLLSFDPVRDHVRARRLEFVAYDVRGTGNMLVENLLSTPQFSGSVSLHTFSPADLLRQLAPAFDISRTDGLKRMRFDTQFSGNADQVSLKDMNLFLDGMTMSGTAGMDIAHGKQTFALKADTLDLDRYLPLFITGEPWYWRDYGLSFFKGLNAAGTLRADRLLVGQQSFSTVRSTFKAESGRVQTVATGDVANGKLDAVLDTVIGTSEKSGSPSLSLTLNARGEGLEPGALLSGHQASLTGRASGSLRMTLSHPECPPDARSIVALRGMRLHAEANWDSLTYRQSGEEPFVSGPMRVACDLDPAEGTEGYPFKSLVTLRGESKSPELNADLRLEGPVRFGPELEYATLEQVALAGKVGGFFMPENQRTGIDAAFSWDTRKDAVSVQRSTVKALGAEVFLSGDFERPFKKNRTGSGVFSIRDFNLKRTLRLYGIKLIRMQDKRALTDARLAGKFKLTGLQARLTELDGVFDGATVAGSIVVPSILKNGFEVDLDGGDVNVDQYFKYRKKVDHRKYRNGPKPKPRPVTMPLQALQHINVRGKVRVDSLKFVDAIIKPAVADIDSWDGDIRIKKITGGFYGGTLDGSWTALSTDKDLSTDIDLELKDFNGGPFMKDIAGRAYVQGRTKMSLSLEGRGRTDYDILKSLDGGWSFSIGKGSYKFSGWEGDKAGARTSFNSANAGVSIKDGIFKVETLDVRSAVMSTVGKGWFNLADDQIDMDIKATFVAVPGVTVQLKGRLSDPKVSTPAGKIIGDTVRNILGLPEKSFKFFRDLFF